MNVLIATILFLNSYPLILSLQNEPLWVWKCDSSKETCSRISTQSKSNDTLYPSLETCRLVCGKYSALWPIPTKLTNINKELIKFSSNFIKFTLSVQDPNVKMFLQDVTQVFISTLPSHDCSFLTILNINITINSERLDLNWNTKEDYTLETVTKNDEISVNILSNTVFGARHGLETLSQLIDLYQNDDGTSCLVTPSQVTISDEPVYPHRGVLIDSARNFVPIDIIKKHIIAMGSSKLNVLHWHITDSQSFPLELPNLPNMTSFGAYSNEKIYHIEEIQELIYFAKLRGIRILIEIDGPSHAGNGWQWGPDSGLGNLAVCINQEPWRSFCIEPPCGQLNPINPNLYQILKILYGDIVNLLPDEDAFHMGGDEVFIPCWNSTEEIIQYLGNKPRTLETFLDLWSDFQEKALQAYDSVARVDNTKIILWTSHLTDPNIIEKYLSKERYIIQTWVPTSDPLPSQLLSLGYKIIVSTKDAWYLDHGFWGTTPYYNWQKVYNNKILKANGTLGGEVCIWGEYVDGTSVIPRTWPRAAAAAERLWSDPSTNANTAQQRFLRHRERLVFRGVNADAVVPRWCYQNEGECA